MERLTTSYLTPLLRVGSAAHPRAFGRWVHVRPGTRGAKGGYRGSRLDPIRNASMARAHCRPSRIAHTTKDWPRRMSPAAKTFATEVR